MMKNLDHLVIAARDTEPYWDDDRSSRVLGSALDRRERRVTRNRVMRRALVVGSVAAVVGLIFLRGANASPTTTQSSEIEPATTLAASSFGDAGYARD
jgi:hypothetical protein